MPVIKWSGSKRPLAARIAALLPEYRRYYEPFVGGGSMLAGAVPERAVCGDICGPLIKFWRMLQERPAAVSGGYRSRWRRLQEEGPPAYYAIRDRFNRTGDPLDLLFLSRTCQNGLIRFNGAGKFNNAIHHTRPGIRPGTLDGLIREWSRLVRGYRFVHAGYERSTRGAAAGDVIYLDPPYMGTVGIYYGRIDYGEFFGYLEGLNRDRIRWVLSFNGRRGGGDVPLIPRRLYKRHHLLRSGASSFNRVITRRLVQVEESVYLSF